MNNTIKFLIETHKKYGKNIQEARDLLDLNTVSGQKLDNLLTPIYRKYGHLDNITKQVDVNLVNVPDSEFRFFNQTSNQMLELLGIDMNYYDQIKTVKPSTQQQSKLTNLYIKSVEVLRLLKKRFTSDKFNSGQPMFEIYSYLHWITDFEVELNKAKQDKLLYANDNNAKIVEYLQNLLYTKPNNILENLNEVAKKFKLSNNDVETIFKEQMDCTIYEYQQFLIEGLGDYWDQLEKRIWHPIKAKIATNSKEGVVKQAQKKAALGAKEMLKDFWAKSKGDHKQATYNGLYNFLTDTNQDSGWHGRQYIVKAELKKWLPKFVQDPKNPTGKPYLPDNLLQAFFTDVYNAESGNVIKQNINRPRQPKTVGTAKTIQQPQPPITPVQSTNVNLTAAEIIKAMRNLPTSEQAKILQTYMQKKP